jgi:hypothetical protein
MSDLFSAGVTSLGHANREDRWPSAGSSETVVGVEEEFGNGGVDTPRL